MTELLLSEHDFESIRRILKRESGISLDASQKSMVLARLQNLLYANKELEIKDLIRDLERNQKSPFLQVLINTLTTNKTHFFREKQHFLRLAEYIKENHSRFLKRPLYIWCGACSTGQEAYSMAMTIEDIIRQENISLDYRILANRYRYASLGDGCLGNL